MPAGLRFLCQFPRRREPIMAEAKSRRDTSAPRPRTRPTKPDLPGNGDGDDHRDSGAAPDRPEATATAPPPEQRRDFNDDEFGFDDEVNNRYEEIKRGGTHIS